MIYIYVIIAVLGIALNFGMVISLAFMTPVELLPKMKWWQNVLLFVPFSYLLIEVIGGVFRFVFKPWVNK